MGRGDVRGGGAEKEYEAGAQGCGAEKEYEGRGPETPCRGLAGDARAPRSSGRRDRGGYPRASGAAPGSTVVPRI